MVQANLMSLPDFLRARIAEDELDSWTMGEGGQRMRYECAAKLRIVELNYFNDPGDDWSSGAESAHDDVLRLLALPYADHPDYREAWRP